MPLHRGFPRRSSDTKGRKVTRTVYPIAESATPANRAVAARRRWVESVKEDGRIAHEVGPRGSSRFTGGYVTLVGSFLLQRPKHLEGFHGEKPRRKKVCPFESS
jgi:hypothetical protein